MKNTWKMETSRDMTSWDLNCRQYVAHTKSRNALEKNFVEKIAEK